MIHSLIAIGGTGAKCVEAITHLSVMGLLPNDLKIVICDPDKSNGNVERAINTIHKYNLARSALKYINNNNGFFQADLEILTSRINTESGMQEEEVWTPLVDLRKKLDQIFLTNEMSPQAEGMFDFLFSSDEKKIPLNYGFRGHPSLGATIFAKAFENETNPYWENFFNIANNQIGRGNNFKVFIIGSIFGGTGASGFPTLAKIIYDKLNQTNNLILGGLLVLPYFRFDNPLKEDIPKYFISFKSDSKESDPCLYTNANEFERVAKTAIEYYHLKNCNKLFNSFYILGDDKKKDFNFSPGAKDQKNSASIIEVFAGLSALDFYNSEVYNNNFILFARNKENEIFWNDFYSDYALLNNFKKNFKKLIRFSLVYLLIVYRNINTLLTTNNPLNKTSVLPFWVDFFSKEIKKERTNISTLLEYFKDYCISFIEWICEISELKEYQEGIKLIKVPKLLQENVNNLEEFEKWAKKFNLKLLDDIFVGGTTENKSIKKIWDDMCNLKSFQIDKNNVFGSFIYNLYKIC